MCGTPCSGHDVFEEMAPAAVLDLDDPDVRIEADFARDAFFDLVLWRRLFLETAAEGTIARPSIVKRRLRRRTKQFGCSVKAIQLDENRTSFLGAPPAHSCESSLDIAAPYIGRHPDRGFEAHGKLDLRIKPNTRRYAANGTKAQSARLIERPTGNSGQFLGHTGGYLAGNRQFALAFELFNCRARLVVDDAAGLDLSIAELAERALYGHHAL
jgi:hypothetical protein